MLPPLMAGLIFITSRLPVLTTLRGEVVDAGSGQPIACRLYVQSADGKWYFPKSDGGSSVEYKKQGGNRGQSIEMHTCLTAHPFTVELPSGRYTITAERGKEYLPATVEIDVTGASKQIGIPLKRWVDMPKRGWYSGDTHVHRPPEEMPVLQQAEDLNVAFPLTSWVTKAFVPPARGDKNLSTNAKPAPVYVDPSHVYWPINTEYELFTVDDKRHQLGAVFVLNHKTPLQHGAPPVRKVAIEAREQGGILELDKHAWEWSMAILPNMSVDLYELSNNHVWRTEWGLPGWGIPAADYMNIERTSEGWTEAGWIDYGFKNYYALLNCGYRMRPTAGTGTGVHPVPLGWGRVYVHVSGGFSYGNWLKGLKEGRSFVTNGPMLMATVDGKEPGQRIQPIEPAVRAFRVAGIAETAVRLDRIEIVVNGQIAKTVKPVNSSNGAGGLVSRFDEQVLIDGSSWIAVRCFEDRPDHRVRFAHTGPVYVEVPGKPLRPRKEEVEFLIKRVQDEIDRSQGILPAAAIEEYRDALMTYQRIAETAR